MAPKPVGSGITNKPGNGMKTKTGIYIHIPFCRRECFYCHFVKRKYDPELADRYIDALQKEIQLRAAGDYVIDTIYIGGGSPSVLKEKQLSSIAGALFKHFTIEDQAEFTIEVNPEDVSREKLLALREMGINRLSIGTQSFRAEDLSYLKRTHGVRQSLSAVECALDIGFTNINVDFIISLPGQNRDTLEDSFSVLKRYTVPHVSAYLLEDVEEGEEKDTRDNDLYFFTIDYLAGLGYVHYEVSNFCRDGFQARHNLKYWKNKGYIGMGLSASGFETGMDYRNARSFNGYFKKLSAGELPVVETRRRDGDLRRIVTGLRLMEGISGRCFEKYPRQLDFLLSNRLLVRRGDKISVASGKILLLNEILGYFL